jgi:hypothetical protein
MSDVRAAALAMPTTAEWTRLTKAVDALRADLGRVRKDYRELEKRVSLVERQHVPADAETEGTQP